MQQAVVDSESCAAHERCPARDSCPTKALFQMDPGEIVTVNGSLCRGCGDCVSACPEKAIRIRHL
ncbi:MAG: 4Fe-4S binding protein [Actinomycetota bacterium]|nr:4Fe-4S binding protein [Actinomycetota bacterium]MCL6092259.1 4Fe-4S binding protein [Actinomycetota bacterium]MDA8167584.1 4Fe-4S binding protein [Actinomycetota bacterium]